MFLKSLIRHKAFILVLFLSVLPLADLLRPGLPVTHDGQDHVARIASFYRNLEEGNMVPRWAGNLNWGYGHPILMFLYPLPSYTASLFRFLGMTFTDSTKMVFAVGFAASVAAMFVWARREWGNTAGIVAAVLYGFAPYRFVDLYVRGAIGEHMAFVFPPVLFLGLRMTAYARSSPSKVSGRYVNILPGWVTVAAGTAGLILSHNALSIMFLGAGALYGLYLWKRESRTGNTFPVAAVSAVLAGFMISAFFWVPAFIEGKYTLRDIVTADPLTGRFVPWQAFLYSPWSYGGGSQLTKSLGVAQWGMIIVALAIAVGRKQKSYLVIGSLILLAGTLFVMTPAAEPIWEAIPLMQKFQFPWRFLSLAVLLASVIGAGVTALLAKKHQRPAAASVILIALVSTAHMWHAKAYRQYPESFFSGVYNGTTDTGESSPIWSVRFMEARPEVPAFTVPADANITAVNRTMTEREYTVSVDRPVRFVENTLYFPGWTAYVNGVRLPPDRLEFQDPAYRGLMTFNLMPGTHDIRFSFGETKLRRASNAVSLFSMVLVMVGIGTIRLVWQKKT